MANRKFPTFIIYVFGVVTPIFAIGMLSILGVEFPKSKAEVALSKWRIDECNETFLYINVPAEPNVWFAVGIEREPKTGILKEIGITKAEEGQTHAFFYFRIHGKYGCPTASYGFAGDGMVWRDLNFDSIFDHCFDYRDKTMMINVDEIWVPGMGAIDVSTEKGIFRFDPNAGKWNLIVANTIPENQ